MADSSVSQNDATPTGDASPILVFDGVCVFCSRWVDFILRHDRSQSIRFAPMQSERGRDFLVANGLDPDDPLSLLYVVGDGAFVGRIAAPGDARVKRHTRHRHLPVGALLEHAFGFVDIGVDDEPGAPREVDEEQHVAR